MNRTQKISNTISDLCTNFFYYDRKEDDYLGLGEIEKSVENGDIEVYEITRMFESKIKEHLAPYEYQRKIKKLLENVSFYSKFKYYVTEEDGEDSLYLGFGKNPGFCDSYPYPSNSSDEEKEKCMELWEELIDSLGLMEAMEMTYSVGKNEILKVVKKLEKLGMEEGTPLWGDEKYEWR